jgi:ketosteroid isomerase-like protein
MAALRRACEALDELALEDVVAPDVMFADPTRYLRCRGFDAMRPMIADVKRLARAIRIQVDQELVCGPWVVTRQTREVTPHATPEQRINVPAISLVRVDGNRIAEWYDYSRQLPLGKSAELP